MELSTPIFNSKASLFALIQSIFDQTTPLSPPIPCYELDSFRTYVSDLNYSDPQLDIIPMTTLKNWNDCIYVRKRDDSPLFNEQSLKGFAFNYISNSLGDLETSSRQNLKEKIESNFDEVDQSSLSQIGNCLSTIGGTAKKYISKHMVEGTYLGYIDQGYFNLGKKFAFQQMMKHNATANALIYLSFVDISFVIEKREQIKDLVLNHLNTQSRWHCRWNLCKRVSDLEYILKGQLDLYKTIKRESPKESIPWKYSYDLKSKILLLSESLFSLKVSFFEHMLKTKPKGEWEECFQKKLNQGVRGINDQFDVVENAPLFEEVLKQAIELAKNTYEHLFPVTKMKREFDVVLNTYVNAIKKDHLTEAKWISLSTNTSSEGTPFNWEQEAGHFENYKRKIDRIFKTQDHLDDIIDELTKRSIQICSEPPEDLLKYQYSYGLNNEIIYSCWKQIDELDNLRIKLRQGFLKDVKTRVNESNKGYWERFAQSLQNKGLRLLLDGEILDKTEPYNEVNIQIKASFDNYRIILNTIKMRVPNHTVNLKPIPDAQDDYPIFYNKDDYVYFIQNNDTTRLTLNTIKYNLERICSFQDNDFFKNQLDVLKKVLEIHTKVTSLKNAIKNFDSYAQYKINFNNEFLKKININYLGSSFKKYVISEKNRQTAVDVLRITKSATNKLSRIASKGTLIDDTKEFPKIYKLLHSQIINIAYCLNQETERFLQTNPILRLKTTTLIFDDGGKEVKLTSFLENIKFPQKEKNTIKIESIIEDYLPDTK